MDSLLNALYNGELAPADLAPPKDPEYRAAVEKRQDAESQRLRQPDRRKRKISR